MSRGRTWLRPGDHAYRIAAAGALVLLVVGTLAYHVAEDWSWIDFMYLCTIAATTVGLGDL